MNTKLLVSLAVATGALAQSITDLIGQTPSLSTLGALVAANPPILNALSNASNITILAPTNDAFSSFLTSAVNESIAADPGLVAAVLSYHVLNGAVPSTAFTETPVFPKTLLTNQTFTNVTGGQVVKAQARDGGVVITSGLLAESHVTTADVTFSGGVVHIIDKVLTIPVSDSATATAANLTSLAGALTQASLVQTVDSAMDVTVFAPTNAAFDAISNLASTLSTDQLTTILTYHVVGGTVGYSSSLTNGQQIETLEGDSVTVTINDNGIFINDAEVVTADVLVSNGVVHVIDNVLNPSNTTAAQPTATAGSPAFSGAAGGNGTSSGAQPTSSSTTPTTAGGSVQQAAVGVAALFGAAAVLANL